MKTIELKATLRDGIGKAPTKAVRNADRVPAVVYGTGEPQHVSVDYTALEKALYSPDTYLVKLDVNGQVADAIMRQPQFHPVTDRILHVDFVRVGTGSDVEIDLPVKLQGSAVGVIKGGILQPMLRKLRVRGSVEAMPDLITIDITNLDLGQVIRVEDVKLPGLTITTSPKASVALIIIPRAVKTEEAADAKKK
jgi:large subunit ribosomal protein L25